MLFAAPVEEAMGVQVYPTGQSTVAWADEASDKVATMATNENTNPLIKLKRSLLM